MLRRLAPIAIALVLSVGCIRRSSPDLSTIKTKTLRWVVERGPTSLDTASCREPACLQHAMLVGEGLTRAEFSEGDSIAVPALAESWTQSESEIVFHLRKEARWSDGAPLKSAQFVDAWRKLFSKGCGLASRASLLSAVRGARAVCEGKMDPRALGFETPDNATIVIHLSRPAPLLPLAMGDPALWPYRSDAPAAGQREASGWPPGAPVLGPFLLQSWTKGSERRYTRNPRYYGGRPAIDIIQIRAVPSLNLRVQLFLDGGADIVDDLPEDYSGYAENAVVVEPTASLVGLEFNTARRPFQSSQVRKLFAQALKKEEIVRLPRWRHKPSASLLAFLPGLKEATRPVEMTAAAARQSLATLGLDFAAQKMMDAGQARSFARPTLALLPREGTELGENLQAQWLKTLDVKCDLASPRPEPKSSGGSAAMTVLEMKIDPFLPWRHLERFTTRGADSFSHWKSRELDSLIARAAEAPSREAQVAALKQAEKLLRDTESVVSPLFFRSRVSLWREWVRNVRTVPLGVWDFRDAVVD